MGARRDGQAPDYVRLASPSGLPRPGPRANTGRIETTTRRPELIRRSLSPSRGRLARVDAERRAAAMRGAPSFELVDYAWSPKRYRRNRWSPARRTDARPA